MSNADQAKAILASALVSLTVDTLFFGLFSGACATSLWLLIPKSVPRQPALGQLGPAVLLGLMFVLALTYLVLDVDAGLHGFVSLAGDPTAMMHGLTDIPDSRSHWATKMTILYIQIVLADAFMVCKLFAVWDRNRWTVTTPALFWLGAVVVGATMIANLFHFDDNLTGDVRTALFFAFSCFTNGLCALLIIGRLIWKYSRHRLGKPRLSSSPWLPRAGVVAADIIIRSAAVYFAASIGLLTYVCLGLPQPLPKWIIGGMPSFIGISTSAIVLWELNIVRDDPEDDTELLRGHSA